MIERGITERNILRLLLMIAAVTVAFGTLFSSRLESTERVEASANEFSEDGKPDAAKARTAFNEAAKVFFSARCVNCHPAGDAPMQGDKMLTHALDVKRGADGRGTEELKCSTCHQEVNIEGDGLPPGAPNWHMPPENQKMVFQGVTAKQLCLNLKDPLKNGGRKSAKDAVHHIASDPLVLWAWSPGNGRTTPPMPHADFLKKMNEWLDNGAACPE
jgi:cytochrome c5